MADRPILFNDAMVRAILAGAKTQTRRPVNRDHVVMGPNRYMYLDAGSTAWKMRGPGEWLVSGTEPPTEFVRRGPFGVARDRLWVRECWCPGNGLARVVSREVLMAPSGAALAPGVIYRADGAELPTACVWRPSIHMPRWASRLTLRVIDVRVERVQDINEDDARAEGMQPAPFCKAGRPAGMEHVEAFEEIWGRTYPGSWERNDWVWVVSFERMQGVPS